MVFHWNLSDNKSLQVSRTLRSILANLNNAIVLIVCIRPFITKSSCPFTNPFVTVTRVPITIDITVTFMFHSFFNTLLFIIIIIIIDQFFNQLSPPKYELWQVLSALQDSSQYFTWSQLFCGRDDLYLHSQVTICCDSLSSDSKSSQIPALSSVFT